MRPATALKFAFGLLLSWPLSGSLNPGAAAAAPGDLVEGVAWVLDGDTLLLHGKRVRLWGIDAPEMRQWPWGAHARARLDELAHGKDVKCVRVDTDRHGRMVAKCGVKSKEHLGRDDLAHQMLLSGFAVVYRTYSHRAAKGGGIDGAAASYDSAERQARWYRLGIWHGWKPPPTRPAPGSSP